jgi:anti-sigma B factor antagonist
VNINVRTRGDVRLIQLQGPLRLGEAVDKFREALEDALGANQPQILVDLAEVPMIDSSGVGVLVKSLSAAKQRGGKIGLISPSKFAVQTLRLVGVLNLFEIFQDEETAVNSFA